METRRPHVSRETRVLLTIVLISLAALWVLARVRFPDRPATANPVPPVLAQLVPESAFESLASTLSQLSLKISPWLAAISLPASFGSGGAGGVTTALRVTSDAAVAVVPLPDVPAPPESARDVIALDRASGLALVRVTGGPMVRPLTWAPGRRDVPRFLVAATASEHSAALAPMLLGVVSETPSPIWRGPIWNAEPPPTTQPGTFLFTLDAALAGVVIERHGRRAIVPGETLLREADRLFAVPPGPPGHLGLSVVPLPTLLPETGVGVVVAAVDPAGPSAEDVLATDVIETVNGETIESVEQWRAHAARLAAGTMVRLGIRRAGELGEVILRAAPFVPAPARLPLGARMRSLPGVGSEVTFVERGSAADRAGIVAGDVITRAGDRSAPTPAQLSEIFRQAAAGAYILTAVTRRGADPIVAALPTR